MYVGRSADGGHYLGWVKYSGIILWLWLWLWCNCRICCNALFWTVLCCIILPYMNVKHHELINVLITKTLKNEGGWLKFDDNEVDQVFCLFLFFGWVHIIKIYVHVWDITRRIVLYCIVLHCIVLYCTVLLMARLSLIISYCYCLLFIVIGHCWRGEESEGGWCVVTTLC